ncbi:hypothetical protein K431DRAFT_289380 [Polychaeton citri CBS 116435]|uniref:Uncharacterized protein n=1 Tax=Polychaeton citri CBS 116435 TaxID=1314669 RepID=A0A9P4PWZ4_9PEZI|nr:hypothetical protein K431DRAFT_289380 [Polychaeton citri CBS 116435]
MPGVPPDAFQLLEQSFENASHNLTHSVRDSLSQRRHYKDRDSYHRKHSSDPSIPSTRIEHLSSDEDHGSDGRPSPPLPHTTVRNAHSLPHERSESAVLRAQLSRQKSGLPPTPPSMSTADHEVEPASRQQEREDAPSPMFADSVRNALESKRSGLSTPVQHQHSPPTPDPSPPSTYASRERLVAPANAKVIDRLQQRPDLSHNGSYAGSFAESFQTAREGNTQNNSPAPVGQQVVECEDYDELPAHWLDGQRDDFREMVNNAASSSHDSDIVPDDPLHANGTHPLSRISTTAPSPDSPIWDGGISTMSRETSISQGGDGFDEDAEDRGRGVIIVTTNPEGEKTPTLEKQQERERDHDWNRYVSFVGSADVSPSPSTHSSRPVTRDGPVSSNNSTRSTTENDSPPHSRTWDRRPSVGLFAFPQTMPSISASRPLAMEPLVAAPSRLRYEENAADLSASPQATSPSASAHSSSPISPRSPQAIPPTSPIFSRVESLTRGASASKRPSTPPGRRDIAREALAAGRVSSIKQKGGEWDFSALTRSGQQRHSGTIAKEAMDAKRYSRMKEDGELDTWAGRDEDGVEIERTGKRWRRRNGPVGLGLEGEDYDEDRSEDESEDESEDDSGDESKDEKGEDEDEDSDGPESRFEKKLKDSVEEVHAGADEEDRLSESSDWENDTSALAPKTVEREPFELPDVDEREHDREVEMPHRAHSRSTSYSRTHSRSPATDVEAVPGVDVKEATRDEHTEVEDEAEAEDEPLAEPLLRDEHQEFISEYHDDAQTEDEEPSCPVRTRDGDGISDRSSSSHRNTQASIVAAIATAAALPLSEPGSPALDAEAGEERAASPPPAVPYAPSPSLPILPQTAIPSELERPLQPTPSMKETSIATMPTLSHKQNIRTSTLTNDAVYRHIQDQNARKIDALANGNAVQVSIIDLTGPRRNQTLRHRAKTVSLRGGDSGVDEHGVGRAHTLKHKKAMESSVLTNDIASDKGGDAPTERAKKPQQSRRKLQASPSLELSTDLTQSKPAAPSPPPTQLTHIPTNKLTHEGLDRVSRSIRTQSRSSNIKSIPSPSLPNSSAHASWVPGDDDVSTLENSLQNHKLRRFARDTGLERDLSVKRNSGITVRSGNSASPQLRRCSREERLERNPSVKRNSLDASAPASATASDHDATSPRLRHRSLRGDERLGELAGNTFSTSNRRSASLDVPPSSASAKRQSLSSATRLSHENGLSAGFTPMASPRRSEYAGMRGLATTPFSTSQFSDRSEMVELCEARGVEIYPHNNHSVVVVEQGVPSSSRPDDSPTVKGGSGLGIDTITDDMLRVSPAPNNHLGVTDEQLIGKPIFTPSPAPPTPPPKTPNTKRRGIRGLPVMSLPKLEVQDHDFVGMASKERNAVNSPLTNPRQAPLPPKINFIPPTPMGGEDDEGRQLAGDRPATVTGSRPGGLVRRESLRDKARRYSEGFALPIWTYRKKHVIRVPRGKMEGPTDGDDDGEERPRNLSPNWRPVGFWNSDSEDDEVFYDDEDVQGGHGRRGLRIARTDDGFDVDGRRNKAASGNRGRRASLLSRRAVSLRLSSRLRAQPLSRSATTATLPRNFDDASNPTLDPPLANDTPPVTLPQRKNSLSQAWRTRHGRIVTIPGTNGEMQFEYVGMQGFRDKMSEVRSAREEREREARREALRESIGVRVFHGL